MTIKKFFGEHRFLSNFWDAPVMLDGAVYPTVEHAYQAAKTTDAADRANIASLPKPGQAKRAGRKLTIRSNWDNAKVGIMFDLVRQKFEIPHLEEKLLATGEENIVEGNTWGDTFWGTCNGIGENNLGKILMRIRDDIRVMREAS